MSETHEPSPLSRSDLASSYEQIAPALYAWARARGRAVLEPDDLVAETWCRALELFDKFDPARSSFRAWIFRVAKYVLLEAARRRGKSADAALGGTTMRNRIDAIPASVTSVTKQVARHDDVRNFLAAIASLDDEDRELVLLCGFEEMPHRDVGAHMQLHPETVTKRWQRLRSKLRDRQGTFRMLA